MIVAAIPISWIAPDQIEDLQFGEEGSSHVEAPAESWGIFVIYKNTQINNKNT